MVKNSREKMKVVECNRGKQWWLLVVVLLCFFSAVSVVQADEAAVFVDGMQDMDFLPMVDADLLAQESDPNYVSSDDDDLFLAEAAQELDGSVNTITEIAAAAGTQFHTHEGASEQLHQKLPEMVKVSALPMTDFEQKIVSHEIDEKKLHLTALSEKLESEIKQNTVLQDELETCQSTVQACEEKMREIDSLVHTIPDCSPEIEAKYQSQIQAFETEINALKHDLSVEVEKSRYIERNSQQVDIKLKLTKNELNVAKIALEQQRLAMDSTVLQYEDKFSILQKEIDRLNMLLAENRRAVKDMKHELSAAKVSEN